MESFTSQQSIPNVPVFTQSEVEEMENLFREVKDECLSKEFCEDLAASFSSSMARNGRSEVSWEQVQSWFKHQKNGSLVQIGSENLGLSFGSPSKVSESALLIRGSRASELEDLTFEAKSLRDNAWYDVASILNYRLLTTGELEARVRFSGFSKSHDEWVSIKNAIRQRSIPLEPSECHRVRVGDLVLCFQERSDQAFYIDAHVLEIQRKLHDIKGCRCIFVVRYDDDSVEEKVQLNKICCRP